ncbi:gp58-like family protein [Latilactobacillus sakei]|uniref:gp58-like family protein n=1 Tax=Latilactobacillus sakei TaxID=1599 RepID=UPI0009787900|nr:gp58-like family protein [Latilactobacillus sakei]
MLKVSDAFNSAFAAPDRELRARVTIGKTVYDSDDLTSINYDSGAMTGEQFSIGSTYMNSAKITFSHLVEGLKQLDEVLVEFGVLKPDGAVEYVKMGTFIVDDKIQMDRNNNTTTIECMDRMTMLGGTYVSKLTYPARIKDVAVEIANMAGVKANETSFARLSENKINQPTGYTYRDAIGLIAQFQMGFALFDRDGLLDIRTLQDNSFKIDPNQYFLKGLVKNETFFKLNGVSCTVVTTSKDENGNETSKTTVLQSGSSSGAQIKLANNVMTQDVLDRMYEALKFTNYYPFSLNWNGNPAVEAGDWLTVEDLQGNEFKVPNMSYTLTYNGGLTATSKADTSVSSPATYSYGGTISNIVNEIGGREGAEGNHIYEGAEDQKPLLPKEGDLWYKHVGPDTEEWIYKDGKWEFLTSTKTANDAQKAADQASKEATEANKQADDAVGKANQAVTDADFAKGAAIESTAKADDAIKEAGFANSTASDAKTAAANAQKDAKDALADAKNSLTNSNSAMADSAEARKDSATAIADAAEAQKDATGALSDAKKALTDSNSAKADSAQARKDSATAAADAVTAKNDAATALTDAKKALTDSGSAMVDSAQARKDSATAIKDAADSLTSAKDAINKVGNLTTSVTSQFTTVNNELKSKVNQTDYDKLKGTVTSQQTEITQNANSIKLKADKSYADTINNNVIKNASSIGLLNNQIALTVSKTELNNTLSSYATQTWTQSQIKLTSDQINLNVSNVDSKINNLTTGAPNMLRNTANFVDSAHWSHGGTLELSKHQYWKNGTEPMLVLGTDNLNEVSLSSERFPIEKGAEYTVQFDAFANYWFTSGDIFLLSRKYGSSNNFDVSKNVMPTFKLSSGGTKHVYATFMAPADMDEGYIRIDNNGSTKAGNKATLWLADIKLAKENKPSPWSPAPEDLVTNVKYAELVVKVDGITATVANKADKTQIEQLSNQISLKADTTALDAVKGTVDKQGSEIALNTKSITLKADQSSVNTIKGTVDKQGSAIDINTKNIALKANQSVADTLSGRVSTAEGKITVQTNQIAQTVSKTELTSKLNGYATQTWTQSQIKSTADSINLNVSKVQTNLDNMQIGSRNLLIGTKDFSKGIFAGNGAVVTNETYNGNRVLYEPKLTSANSYHNPYNMTTSINADATVYTVSFYAKSDVNGMVTRYYFYSPTNTISSINNQGRSSRTSDGLSELILSNNWEKYWITWTTAPSDSIKHIVLGRRDKTVANSDIGGIYLTSPMFVEGNKPLPWSPAPEDNASDVEFAELVVKVDGITATVANKADKTQITQLSNQISLKADTTVLNALKGTVDKQGSEITLNTKDIALKASSADVNTLTGRVTTAEGKINVLNNQIALTVTKNDLTNTLKPYATQTWTQGQIKTTADSINLNVSKVQTDLNGTKTQFAALEVKVSGIQTTVSGKADQSQVTQLAGQITSVVSGIDKLNTEYSQVQQTIKGIQTTVGNKADQSQVTQLAGQITSVVSGMSAPNLIPNSGLFKDTSFWRTTGSGVALTIYQHAFYRKGNMLQLSASSTAEVMAMSERVSVTGGVKYTLTLLMFGASSVKSVDIYFMGRKHGETADYKDIHQLAANITPNPSGVSKLTYTFTAHDIDEGYVRIDNNGSTTTGTSYLYFGEVKLERGDHATPWIQNETTSEITQLKDSINLRVTKGDVINQINISPESILIAGQKVHITGQTSIDNAVIKDAMIANVKADKITAGTLNAANVNVINLNANNITTGTIKGANLSLNLNTGQVLFQKGSIKSTNGNLNIRIDDGSMSLTNSQGEGAYFIDGKIAMTKNDIWTNGAIHYGQLTFGNNIFGNALGSVSGVRLEGAGGVIVGNKEFNPLTLFGPGKTTPSGGGFAANNSFATLASKGWASIEGGTSYTVPFSTNNPSIVAGVSGKHSEPGAWMPTSDKGPASFVKGKLVGLYAEDGGFSMDRGTTADLAAAVDERSGYILSAATYARTYASGAQMMVTENGVFGRISSASKYKLAIGEISTLNDEAHQFLSVKPKQWFDKSESEALADTMTTGNTDYIDDAKALPHTGFIAEDLYTAGLDSYVIRGNDGSIESIQYDRLPVLHHELIRELFNRLDAAEIEIYKLKQEVINNAS